MTRGEANMLQGEFLVGGKSTLTRFNPPYQKVRSIGGGSMLFKFRAFADRVTAFAFGVALSFLSFVRFAGRKVLPSLAGFFFLFATRFFFFFRFLFITFFRFLGQFTFWFFAPFFQFFSWFIQSSVRFFRKLFRVPPYQF